MYNESPAHNCDAEDCTFAPAAILAGVNIINNKRAFRFEVEMPNGEYVSLTYRWLKGKMLLMQTSIPSSAKDTDVPERLITHVLEHARNHNLRIMVYCPVVAKFMRENEEYDGLVG